MLITRKMLTDWNACDDGLKWFDAHFSEDGAEYQEILNKLAEENEGDYAEWLLSKAGPEETVIELNEIVSENSFFFSGQIKVTSRIQIKFKLAAGRGIEAGWGIEAGEGIKAGWGIEAGEYGIFAGLKIRISEWNMYAVVSAPSKPQNMISGFFVQK